MNAVAAVGGVEQEACDGVRAVGGFDTLIERHLGGFAWGWGRRGCAVGVVRVGRGCGGRFGTRDGIGSAGEQDGETFAGERGLEAGSEGEGDVFFEGIFCDACAEVGATVGGSRTMVLRLKRGGSVLGVGRGLGLATGTATSFAVDAV